MIMRALFVALLLFIGAGLTFCIVVGLMQR